MMEGLSKVPMIKLRTSQLPREGQQGLKRGVAIEPPAGWYIELPMAVDPVDSIKTGPIEEKNIAARRIPIGA